MASFPIIEQAQNFFKKLSMVQRITLGVAVAAAIGGISLLVINVSKPQLGAVAKNLDEKDAAAVVEKLSEKGMKYELTDNGSTVMVPMEQLYEARMALAKDNVLENSSGSLGYALMDRTDLSLTDFKQNVNFKRAMEGELQKTIGTMEEVSRVRVMLVLPQEKLFQKDQKKPTASVYLRLKNGRSINKLNVEGIQNLVASSVEGLSANDVTVVDQRGQILSEIKKETNSLAGMTASQFEQQQHLDEEFVKKVQSQLDAVLGPGNASVRVSSELDFTQSERTKETYDPDGQVVRSQEKISEARKSQDSLEYPTVNSESNVGKERANYEIPKTVERTVNQVGVIKRVSVAVVVDGKKEVVEQNGEKKLKYTPRGDEELQKITQLVRNAIGYDPQRNDQVSVVNMQFDSTLEEEELKSDNWNLPLTPKDIIEKVLLVLAMLIAVWMVRKLFASPQVRRKIEEIISPPTPKLPEDPAQLALANGFNPALSGYTVGPNGQLLPMPQQETKQLEENTMPNRDELIARARARLDSNLQSDLNEDQIMVEEMKQRIQKFFDDESDIAAKLVKVLLNKNPGEK